MDPKAALRRYLEAAEIKPATFARTIGYDRSNFHKLLNDSSTKPSLRIAAQIERETRGAIPMSAWADVQAAA